MNTTDVLRQAKELLSDPERWNRAGGFGRSPNGERADSIRQFQDAVSFCAVGAIARQLPETLGADLDTAPAVCALVQAAGVSSWASVAAWNDRRATHADLIAAFDRALLLVAGETPVEQEVPVAA